MRTILAAMFFLQLAFAMPATQEGDKGYKLAQDVLCKDGAQELVAMINLIVEDLNITTEIATDRFEEFEKELALHAEQTCSEEPDEHVESSLEVMLYKYLGKYTEEILKALDKKLQEARKGLDELNKLLCKEGPEAYTQVVVEIIQTLDPGAITPEIEEIILKNAVALSNNIC